MLEQFSGIIRYIKIRRGYGAMRKKIAAILLAGSMILSMDGCGGKEQGDSATLPDTKTELSGAEDSQKAEKPGTEAGEAGESEEFSFAELNKLQFIFSSGAGGWATLLHINADGTFSGEWFDGELGITGEGYPNGTMCQCNFSGKFTQPVKVNDFTYSMQIEEISYEEELGTEEIVDGVMYCYGDAYGLTGAEDILFYTPGAPLAELPEEYKSWIYLTALYNERDVTELPFWGLYNVAQECGFSSCNIVDTVKETVAMQEEVAASLEASMEKDSLTQAEYNEKSMQLYAAWDYALNSTWNALKQILDENAMKELLAEQREWIAMKEQAAAEAGAEVEGGSMQPMLINLKAAELTKERVYELLERLE